MQLQEPTLEGVTKEKKFYDIDTRIRKYRHETLMSKKVFFNFNGFSIPLKILGAASTKNFYASI